MNDRVENGLRMARSEAGVGGERLAVGKEKGREMNQILPHCGSQPLTATRQPQLPVMGRDSTTCCPSCVGLGVGMRSLSHPFETEAENSSALSQSYEIPTSLGERT